MLKPISPTESVTYVLKFSNFIAILIIGSNRTQLSNVFVQRVP